MDTNDFVADFIAGGEDRHTFGSERFQDRFTEEALRLVLSHREACHPFGDLIVAGIEASLIERPTKDLGGSVMISAYTALQEHGVHRNLIEALNLVAKGKTVPEIDRLKAAQLKDDIDGR